MSQSLYDSIDSINESIGYGTKRTALHLYTEDAFFNGREITIREKPLINFGSCSYLGLETDRRLKDAAIDAVQKYGTQFSSSRTYISFTLYKELEDLLEKMFGVPVVLSSCSSLGHKAVIPIIINDKDAAIYDHQCHISMQDEITKLQSRGVKVMITRHNRLDELEDKIRKLEGKHSKIWYLIDGIYSMYGDSAPLKDLSELQQKYPSLHLYIDDAHGMSWAGLHGTGYALSQIRLNPRIVLTTSLAKGFASAGGVFVFGDSKLYEKVRTWGGPLTYSGPQQPAVIGASIASAKIHLSNEIYLRQNELSARIEYCNQEFKKYNLPVISNSSSPIFFIGTGLNKVTFNLIKRMMDEKLFLNPAIFPAVPEICSGLRFTLTLHHKPEDIKRLAETLSENLPLALEEEQRSFRDIERAFKIRIPKLREAVKLKTTSDDLCIQYETSIQKMPAGLWNKILGNQGVFTWENMALMENVFTGNTKEEDNWGFHYFMVKDSGQNIILATFFTSVLIKDDMVLPASVSQKLEILRKDDPYFLCSRCFLMGTLLSDGQHLYIDRSNKEWKKALGILIDSVWKQQEKSKCSLLYLRDFSAEDEELKDLLFDYGFIRMKMPSTHVFENPGIASKDEFLKSLPHRRRFHLKKDVLNNEDLFDLQVVDEMSEKMIMNFYMLYKQVRERSLEINSFALPFTLFQELNKSNKWDKVILKIKATGEQIAFVFAYKSHETANYFPLIIGMDYAYHGLKVYKQMLYQTLLLGIKLKKQNIFLGLTATLEKRKLGALAKQSVAYLQTKDNLNEYLIEQIRDS